MDKNQFDLCLEILKRFHQTGILSHLVLVGSWCLPFYRDYFKGQDYFSSLRTRDMDFLVQAPSGIKEKVDIPALLQDLGFVVDFRGEEGYIRLVHPELIVEFLVPAKGPPRNKPYNLSKLGLNAQTLRFLDLLNENTIEVEVEGIPLTLPHPAGFSL